MAKCIYVVAPANTMRHLPQTLRDIGIKRLEAAGFEIRIGKHVDEEHYHTAGTVEHRVADLMAGFRDPGVDIVMPVYGGYNGNQLLAHLDYTVIRESKKPIVGFSDTTALLASIAKLAGSPVIHGPSFSVFCDPAMYDYTLDGFLAVLEGRRVRFVSPEFFADDAWYMKSPEYGPRVRRDFDGWWAYREGEARGKMVGGNLETLGALAGTKFFPDIEGRILFVEDSSGKNPGMVHRDLTRLSQMGVLERITGLVIGLAPAETPLSRRDHLRAILDDVLPRRSYPVVCDVACSHVDPMVSIPFHREAVLLAGKSCELTVEGEGPKAAETVTIGPWVEHRPSALSH